jgi:hypothetical protein
MLLFYMCFIMSLSPSFQRSLNQTREKKQERKKVLRFFFSFFVRLCVCNLNDSFVVASAKKMNIRRVGKRPRWIFSFLLLGEEKKTEK